MHIYDKIKKCKACNLYKYRRHVVIGKGDIPADILFLGEAPGRSEDLRGIPFIGPAGRLLDFMIDDAMEIIVSIDHINYGELPNASIPKYFICNTVMCRPTDSKDGENRKPTAQEVLACAPNLIQIIKSVQPKIVVFLGKVSEQYYKKEFPTGIVIHHPAYLLRQGGKSSPNYMINVRKLADVFKQSLSRW